MATRNKSARNKLRARDVIRTQQTADLNKKLHRAGELSAFLSLDLRRRDYGPMPLYLPAALSYIADDVCDIQAIVKEITSA